VVRERRSGNKREVRKREQREEEKGGLGITLLLTWNGENRVVREGV